MKARRGLVRHREWRSTGIVDEHVELAVAIGDLCEQRVDGGIVANVDREEFRLMVADGWQRFRRSAAADPPALALVPKAFRDAAADALGAAGDEHGSP